MGLKVSIPKIKANTISGIEEEDWGFGIDLTDERRIYADKLERGE